MRLVVRAGGAAVVAPGPQVSQQRVDGSEAKAASARVLSFPVQLPPDAQGPCWRCEVCGKVKDLRGDHLQGKAEVRSDCWPCAKKRLFRLEGAELPQPVTAPSAPNLPQVRDMPSRLVNHADQPDVERAAFLDPTLPRSGDRSFFLEEGPRSDFLVPRCPTDAVERTPYFLRIAAPSPLAHSPPKPLHLEVTGGTGSAKGASPFPGSGAGFKSAFAAPQAGAPLPWTHQLAVKQADTAVGKSVQKGEPTTSSRPHVTPMKGEAQVQAQSETPANGGSPPPAAVVQPQSATPAKGGSPPPAAVVQPQSATPVKGGSPPPAAVVQPQSATPAKGGSPPPAAVVQPQSATPAKGGSPPPAALVQPQSATTTPPAAPLKGETPPSAVNPAAHDAELDDSSWDFVADAGLPPATADVDHASTATAEGDRASTATRVLQDTGTQTESEGIMMCVQTDELEPTVPKRDLDATAATLSTVQSELRITRSSLTSKDAELKECQTKLDASNFRCEQLRADLDDRVAQLQQCSERLTRLEEHSTKQLALLNSTRDELMEHRKNAESEVSTLADTLLELQEAVMGQQQQAIRLLEEVRAIPTQREARESLLRRAAAGPKGHGARHYSTVEF